MGAVGQPLAASPPLTPPASSRRYMMQGVKEKYDYEKVLKALKKGA